MSRSRHPSPPKRQPAPPDADPFDRWVDRQLHRLYDDVVSEGIPPRLRDLLENADHHDRDDATAPDGSGDGSIAEDGEDSGGERT